MEVSPVRAAPPTTGGPPRPPFIVSLGITGHRKASLRRDEWPRLRERLGAAIQLLKQAALEIHARESHWFTAAAPQVQFVSPLAEGADQLAAEVALAEGLPLHAILPFARDEYLADFAGEGDRERFDGLLDRAHCRLELPGERVRELEAYVMAGRATVAHCDVLIALWDGQSPRGRGGTAEVVDLALARGTPVVHIPVDAAVPERILWAAFDPAVMTQREDRMAERPFDHGYAERMLSALLLPPASEEERSFLQRFAAERTRRIRARVEYPMLLAAAGVAGFGRKDVQNRRCAELIEEEWRHYRSRCAEVHELQASLDLLERSYSWSDQLATHFAQTYRSGHIFNFLLGGFAVCLGLSSFMAPQARLWLALVECVITIAIILNTRVGVWGEWHRRWLDYRQLAERLRPMRSLKLLGLAAPDPPGTATNPVPARWIDWYSAAIWRAMGCPSGSIGVARSTSLAAAIAEHEVAPQVAYHEKSARQIDLLDQRLQAIATFLFWATLVASFGTAAGLAFAPEWVTRLDNWLTLISAGFPALGTAVFGIRFQGDFGGSARRSLATANALRQIETELRKEVSLARAADLVEEAARTMLADLDQWRLVNQQHDLDVA